MELIETPWHLFSAVLLVVGGALVTLKFRTTFKLPARRALLLYGWHTLWCMVYLWYSINNVADATMYYDVAKSGNYSFAPGTEFVNFLTGIFVDYLGVSYLGAFLAFNIFGVIGLLAFDGAMRAVTEGKRRKWRQLATLIVFLPSVSFWSSAIGKDSISFMAAGVALWASLDFARRSRPMIFAVFAMFLVRPHIAGFMVLALVFATVLQSNASIFKKVFFFVASLGAVGAMIPFALQYAGLSDISISGAIDYVEDREIQNTEGGGAIGISSMSLPLKIVAYLFRPFPFEANSIPQLAASADNMIMMFMVLVGVFNMIKQRSLRRVELNYFALIYSMLALLVLAMTTANLGIAVRQKWMFVPMLLCFLMSVIGTSSKRSSQTQLQSLKNSG